MILSHLGNSKEDIYTEKNTRTFKLMREAENRPGKKKRPGINETKRTKLANQAKIQKKNYD